MSYRLLREVLTTLIESSHWSDQAAEIAAVSNISAFPSHDEAMEAIRAAVPVLIRKYMINSRAVKVCGGISRAFEAEMKRIGVPTVTSSRPGHFYNLVATGSTVIMVDLSAIQFECKPDYDAYDDFFEAESVDVERLLDLVKADPFRAVKIEVIGTY